MYLALTYDHRLLDGREAVTFLVKVGFYLFLSPFFSSFLHSFLPFQVHANLTFFFSLK